MLHTQMKELSFAAPYTSTEWLAAERRSIFAQSWISVGPVEGLEGEGAYRSVQVGVIPVLVIRREGNLRAFHNICQHRGMTILEGEGCAGGDLTCPYHGWRYDSNGSLVLVPQRRQEFPELDPARYSLPAVEVVLWRGEVLVRLLRRDDAADPFAFVDSRARPFAATEFPAVVSEKQVVECNWKLLIENHVDLYHLWYLHSDTLRAYDHTRLKGEMEEGSWRSWEPERAPAKSAAEGGMQGIGAHLVFPNLMVVDTPRWQAIYSATPLSPERTQIDLVVRCAHRSPAAAMAEVHAFVDQDVEACERVQRGIRESSFQERELAGNHERFVVEFRRSVRSMILLAEPDLLPGWEGSFGTWQPSRRDV